MALPETGTGPHGADEGRRSRLRLIAAGVVGVGVLAAAIGLWARHGAAVFFDMVAAGIAYCF